MHAALPSRPLVLCQIRAPEDAAHAVDGDICGAAHDADYDVGVAHGSDTQPNRYHCCVILVCALVCVLFRLSTL